MASKTRDSLTPSIFKLKCGIWAWDTFTPAKVRNQQKASMKKYRFSVRFSFIFFSIKRYRISLFLAFDICHHLNSFKEKIQFAFFFSATGKMHSSYIRALILYLEIVPT